MDLNLWRYSIRLLVGVLAAASIGWLSMGGAPWNTEAGPPLYSTIPRPTARPGGGGGGGDGTVGGKCCPVGPGLFCSATVGNSQQQETVNSLPDSLTTPGEMCVRQTAVDWVPLPATSKALVASRGISVTIEDANDVPVPAEACTGVHLVAFTYTPADLAQANNNPANFVVLYFDAALATWVEIPTAPDAVNPYVIGQSPVCQGTFMLALRTTPTPVPQP